MKREFVLLWPIVQHLKFADGGISNIILFESLRRKGRHPVMNKFQWDHTAVNSLVAGHLLRSHSQTEVSERQGY